MGQRSRKAELRAQGTHPSLLTVAHSSLTPAKSENMMPRRQRSTSPGRGGSSRWLRTACATSACACALILLPQGTAALAAQAGLPFRLPSLLTAGGRQRESLKAELLDLVRRSSAPGAGSFSDDEDAKRFDQIFAVELPALNPTPDPARSKLFSGEWECRWTSETELNFLVRSGLLGDGWERTYQVIDVPGNRLENRIEFENGGSLSVGSTIVPDGERGERFNINFCDASVAWRGFKVPIPPLGSGWGELLYLDEDMRLQRDIRGDMIVATRVR